MIPRRSVNHLSLHHLIKKHELDDFRNPRQFNPFIIINTPLLLFEDICPHISWTDSIHPDTLYLVS